MTPTKGGARKTRVTRYRQDFARQAKTLCRLGASEEDLCEAFAIEAPTLKTWRTAYPAFDAACRAGEKDLDAQVTSALLNRATGYSYQAQELVKTKDGMETITVTKHMPPDLASCIFWLKNRQPGAWRDKIDPRQPDGETRAPVSDEERAKAAAVLLAKQAVLDGWDRAKGQGTS